MKTWKCTDGFVTKTIDAKTASEAAEAYALTACEVDVVEVDDDGNEIGNCQTISVAVDA